MEKNSHVHILFTPNEIPICKICGKEYWDIPKEDNTICDAD